MDPYPPPHLGWGIERQKNMLDAGFFDANAALDVAKNCSAFAAQWQRKPNSKQQGQRGANVFVMYLPPYFDNNALFWTQVSLLCCSPLHGLILTTSVTNKVSRHSGR